MRRSCPLRKNKVTMRAGAIILVAVSLFVVTISSYVNGFSSQHTVLGSASYLTPAALTSMGQSLTANSVQMEKIARKRINRHRNSSVLHSSASSLTRGAPADDNANASLTEREIDESMEYLAQLIRSQLDAVANSNDGNAIHTESGTTKNMGAYELARHRFIDLTTTTRGEEMLENLFLHNPTNSDGTPMVLSTQQIQLAIITLQSLLIFGAQIGVKGSEETQKKMVRHLFRPGDDRHLRYNKSKKRGSDVSKLQAIATAVLSDWSIDWDEECVRRLKFYRDVELGKTILAKLQRKRTSQGAHNLLVEMKVWMRHEDTVLLRSGFPIRFWGHEVDAAERVVKLAAEDGGVHDPESILGIRKDLRHLKVYTIDGASTLDVDDGISVERVMGDASEVGGGTRYRYWIHIADADAWAPRGSDLLKAAERRGSSLYLPTTHLSMFPPNLMSIMSLEAWEDRYALSLGVELYPNGAIIPSSVIVTPSIIHVDYRLTYEQVDEMLDEGVGYTEEWQIGKVLDAATKRREMRVGNGSTEGMVPTPIPRAMVDASYNDESGDYDLEVKIETSHNSGMNMTAGGIAGDNDHYDPYCSPVSSSNLMVTEMMILAGEAMGKWQQSQSMQDNHDLEDGCIQLPNTLELPFRCQSPPDFKSRERETKHMNFLLDMNRRYPHAWYARRFFNKVTVSEVPGIHFGMGLDCYVQWSSPIRRFTDLQVHSAVKRYLRRKRVNYLLHNELPLPLELTSIDLGCDITNIQQTTEVDPIDYTSGLGMIFATRPIQSSSSNYWLFEYIKRLVDGSEEEIMFESIVLGCVNQERLQYAIYVYELGLEHRYLSEAGELEEGRKLWLKGECLLSLDTKRRIPLCDHFSQCLRLKCQA